MIDLHTENLNASTGKNPGTRQTHVTQTSEANLFEIHNPFPPVDFTNGSSLCNCCLRLISINCLS